MLVLGCLGFVCNEAEAKTYKRQLIKNSAFNNGLDYWDCRYRRDGEYYNRDCDVWPTIQQDSSGNYYLSIGVYPFQWVDQVVSIPADAGKVIFQYDYYFHSNDKNSLNYLFVEAGDPDEWSKNYARDSYTYSDGDLNQWWTVSHDITSAKGKDVEVSLDVMNSNEDQPSWARLDNIKIYAKSFSVLKGRVENKARNYKRFKNAKVIIKNKKGKTLWKGKTNDRGRFKATGLKGSKKKKKIIIKKGDYKKVIWKRIKWGTRYNKRFVVKKP